MAALTDNPGCTRRRVIDACGIQAHQLAAITGFEPVRGQSPFAITSGDSFEARLKRRSEYQLLVEALRPFVALPEQGLVVVDLNNVGTGLTPQEWLDERVRRTGEVLSQLAAGVPDSPHLVDHPMLTFDLAGTQVYLEPDALTFRVGSDLELVEIKSYPVIDGQADPAKVSATAGQSAVYLLAIRATLQRLGFNPDIVRWSVILVAPRNFGRYPTAHRIPLKKKALSIQRVLAAASSAESVVAQLADDFTLDFTNVPGGRQSKMTATALSQLAPLYVPECLSSCDLSLFCRHEAILTDNPSRLGRAARDVLGDVDHLAEALTLARLTPDRVAPDLSDVAASLRAARQALERARAACGLDARPEGAPGGGS